MKKTYLQPMAEALPISTELTLAVSGKFVEGETTEVDVHGEEINGGDAWSRRRIRDEWDDWDDADDY